MNQPVTRPLRRRGGVLVAGIAIGVMAQVLAPQGALAHASAHSRWLNSYFNLCNGGSGIIDHNIYAISVSSRAYTADRCFPDRPWPLPQGWIVDHTYVYGNAQYCTTISAVNPNNGASAFIWDGRYWPDACPGRPHPWLTIDVQSWAFNPNNGGFWQGGWVARPTAGHQF